VGREELALGRAKGEVRGAKEEAVGAKYAQISHKSFLGLVS